MSNSTADKYKADGNQAFQRADYPTAESHYTRAITHDPTNPTLFTNRALTRLRLSRLPEVISDAERALELKPPPPGQLKAYTYLGQAHLVLGNAKAALKASRRAYELAVETHSPSIGGIAESVLRAKKAVWEQSERQRIIEEQSTLRKLLQIIDRDSRQQNSSSDEASELKREVEAVFARADAERCRRREVPDYLVDQISFGIMLDPVITKTGHSYDRATLIDHLKRSKTDPLTREPLFESDLRPNFGLRAAGEEFLAENGWAVDW